MDNDLRTRTLSAGVALALFLPLLWFGGVPFQLLIGLLAMFATHELLSMRGLETFSIEGVLAMLASLVYTLPLETYLPFLPVDGNVIAYGLLVLLLLGTTVFVPNYSFEDAVYPIATSFYVGLGFNSLIDARIAGFDKVLLALFVVWASDSGAYLVGRKFGKKKLAPLVSPNKTVEGALGGIVSAVVVSFVFALLDSSVIRPYNLLALLLFSVFFSIAGQFGDLVESAMKRHFGVKDSGKFIPGHGGVLDRFDSLLFVFPLMHFLGFF
ncbi:Phosphatidate cytidylyltransferase [Streptococcus sp. DD10]|uniref:phosphatidate cytidylyltransferase n=1 Tax=Streptococcus sp. DD10 TaxID=1777878 RepID=UPI0007962040|nr:phosphatidate cytidylyltransferase [Streptococcus sp. DD10]KXT72200.1 Phosphatidate cytidylyltransferase [Streptococcus sp. DD10]